MSVVRPAIAGTRATTIVLALILLGKHPIHIDLQQAGDNQYPREDVGQLVRHSLAHVGKAHVGTVYLQKLGAARLPDLLIEAAYDELHAPLSVALAVDRHQVGHPVVCRPIKLTRVGNRQDNVFPLCGMACADRVAAIGTATSGKLLAHRLDEGQILELVGNGAGPPEHARKRAFEMGLRRLPPDMLGKYPDCVQEKEKALPFYIHRVSLAEEFLQVFDLTMKVHG